MQNHSPLASLAALSLLASLLTPPAATKRDPDPAPKPAADPMGALGLDEMLAQVFGTAPAPSPIAQVCAIPQDIAERCGMNGVGFDPHGQAGGAVAMLAAVLANLRELSAVTNEAGRAKCAIADSHIGAAIAAIYAVKTDPNENPAPVTGVDMSHPV